MRSRPKPTSLEDKEPNLIFNRTRLKVEDLPEVANAVDDGDNDFEWVFFSETILVSKRGFEFLIGGEVLLMGRNFVIVPSGRGGSVVMLWAMHPN